jgi:hypothetical protein
VPEDTAKFREETSKKVQRKPPHGIDISSRFSHCKINFLQRSKMGFCNINQGFLALLRAGRGKSGTRLALIEPCFWSTPFCQAFRAIWRCSAPYCLVWRFGR